MQLLSNRNGEDYLRIYEQSGDQLIVQFVDGFGNVQGKPFADKLSSLLSAGWQHCNASLIIGLSKFVNGETQSADVSYALHQMFPLGREVLLPNGVKGRIASYANTHKDGYYMYLQIEGVLKRLKMDSQWRLLPSLKLLALPYYPAPLSKQEIAIIDEFDKWAGGF